LRKGIGLVGASSCVSEHEEEPIGHRHRPHASSSLFQIRDISTVCICGALIFVGGRASGVTRAVASDTSSLDIVPNPNFRWRRSVLVRCATLALLCDLVGVCAHAGCTLYSPAQSVFRGGTGTCD